LSGAYLGYTVGLNVPMSAGGGAIAPAVPIVFAALFDLSDPARYLHWHFFQMSVANVIVILLMIAVFVAAILIPFPKRERTP